MMEREVQIDSVTCSLGTFTYYAIASIAEPTRNTLLARLPPLQVQQTHFHFKPLHVMQI